MDWKKIVSTDQTHTANVRAVTEKDAGHGITRPKTVFDIDGQVTDVPGLVLITYHADCVPLFFVDPVKKAMELLPLGPVVIIDTPGLDDEGELGRLRVQKAMQGGEERQPASVKIRLRR